VTKTIRFQDWQCDALAHLFTHEDKRPFRLSADGTTLVVDVGRAKRPDDIKAPDLIGPPPHSSARPRGAQQNPNRAELRAILQATERVVPFDPKRLSAVEKGTHKDEVAALRQRPIGAPKGKTRNALKRYRQRRGTWDAVQKAAREAAAAARNVVNAPSAAA
jgi:hypothetical protein